MRVIAGIYRHRLLQAPPGTATRPTLDRVKVSMFNILQPYLYSARVLDLFSGSGALGIEALSRGASRVHFNDVAPLAVRTIHANLSSLQIHSNCTVTTLEYSQLLEQLYRDHQQFEVILLDPPFQAGLYEDVLKLILQFNLLVEQGMMMVECPLTVKIATLKEWQLKTYVYGEVQLITYQRPMSSDK